MCPCVSDPNYFLKLLKVNMTMMTKTILSAITFITISEQQTKHTEREGEAAEQSRAEPPGRVEQNRTKRNNEE